MYTHTCTLTKGSWLPTQLPRGDPEAPNRKPYINYPNLNIKYHKPCMKTVSRMCTTLKSLPQC